MEAKRHRQKSIPRVALLFPKDSAWRKLFDSKTTNIFITLAGLDHGAFEYLADKFQPCFDGYSPYGTDGYVKRKTNQTKGRKRLIKATDGLVLAWTRTRGSQMDLQMIFGMPQSVVSLYLEFGIQMLLLVLQDLEEATIVIPNTDTFRNMQSMVSDRHPRLSDIWCTMDG